MHKSFRLRISSRIRLFFDAETFQHVRTEYQHDISAPAVTRPEDAARQQDTHLKLTEDFSDFRKEGSLTLPHTYKIQLTFDTPNNALRQDCVLTLNQFLLNKELDRSQFTISGNQLDRWRVSEILTDK